MEDRKAALSESLEDTPLLVEVRGLLRRRTTVLVGSEERPGSGFVLAPEHDLAVGHGRPEPALRDALERAAGDAGVEADALRLRAAPAAMEEWVAAGEGAGPRAVEVLVHGGERRGLVELAERHGTARLRPGDPLADDLPPGLRRELRALPEWPRAAVALAGGSPVALAHAFVETEGHWDVSVETDPPFRREGFGAAAVAALALDRLDAGRVAVWAAAGSNVASLALARRLGFAPAGSWGEWRLA